MWMPGQTAEVGAAMRADGLQIDPAQLGRLDADPLNAVVSLGGCSAPSSVHKAGRNQSSLRVRIHPIPQQGGLGLSHRRFSGGFLAKSLGEELPAAPGSRIYVIEDMRDVTAEMLKSVSDKLNGFARYERLDTNRKALIAACEGQPNSPCDVVPIMAAPPSIPAEARS
ncbi:S46 family peptidase [Mesorhizobium sp. L48C026A00]|uniref:S46 family peptidase n=1 Tax=Mesorhizobium sp. L48C026A00 TaxID=1287182 RepID=UPI0003D066A9|nr:S46 family peptidase [Mesorhizobium sp. L48C026A00]ESZ07384.1 hypothetical protein X737_34275 [Mesorhizobium sp. L48C026A00]